MVWHWRLSSSLISCFTFKLKRKLIIAFLLPKLAWNTLNARTSEYLLLRYITSALILMLYVFYQNP